MHDQNLSNLFYRLPRLTLLAAGFILMLGSAALMTLPRQEDPTMTERYGTVEVRMPGATAGRVESLVTEPLETGLREIEEIKEIDSVSRPGYTNIQLELYQSVGRDRTDVVWSEIRSQLDEIRPVLPADADEPLLTPRVPLAVTIGIGITGDDGVPLSLLGRIAEELRQRLANLPGTKETDLYGEPEEEILVEADPHALAQADLTIPRLAALIGQSDTRIAAGRYESANSSLVVEVKGELDSAERIASIPLRRAADGALLRVADLAGVSRSALDPPAAYTLINNRRGVLVTAKMEGGHRVDLWSRNAKRIIDRYRATLPAGIRFDTVIDQNHYTNARLTALAINLTMAMTIVLGVLLFMMGLRSALIVGSALPLSMAMVLAGLRFMDIPLHQMSVTGLIIALGLLIDNAIVVVEEYKHRRALGAAFGTAISQAVRHLFVPLLASTATTAFAFAPIALSPGDVGDFTGTLGVSVILSVSSSFLLAMTIIPAFAAYIDKRFPVRDRRQTADGRQTAAWWVNGYQNPALQHAYRRSLLWTLQRPLRGIALTLVLPLAGFVLSTTLVNQFFPPVDRNQFQLQLTLPEQTSVGATLAQVERARRVLATFPQITVDHWFVGESAPEVYYNMTGNNDGVQSFAGAFVTTRATNDPRRILVPLQRALMAEFPDARIHAAPFEQGPPFQAPIEVRVIGPDLDTLKQIGEQIRLLLSQTRGVTYSTATLSGTAPQLSVYTNENRLSLLGLDNASVPAQLGGELSGIRAGAIMEGNTEMPIRVRYASSVRDRLDAFGSLPIIRPAAPAAPAAGPSTAPATAAATGMPTTPSTAPSTYGGIPLETVADIHLEPTATQINRFQGERINLVSGYLLPYEYPSVSLDDFHARFDAADITLPEGYRLEFGGEQEARSESVSGMVTTFVVFLWMMVAVVVISLNSFRHAAIIGMVGFLSIGLALFGVWLSGSPMGYMALIGTLGLIGLAINGAIIVLSSLKASAPALAADLEATADTVLQATRHIVSTTVTTIGGFLPLIFFGGYFWPPLAMAIAGGVAGSAILALYFVPVLFHVIARADVRKHEGRAVSGLAVQA